MVVAAVAAPMGWGDGAEVLGEPDDAGDVVCVCVPADAEGMTTPWGGAELPHIFLTNLLWGL